ncbi:MAG: ABC transporter ATP-binding protein [Acidimicrobiia bacterium]|nr:ABC transporter ATP-binding protein [Acidimicrobiia bacterium]
MRRDRQRQPALEVRGLGKTYPGGIEAVRGIDFTVGVGEAFGLLGPNGAGKSTTIGMLTTTIRPSTGWARLGGLNVATEPLAARALSAVVFQEPTVDRALTGRRNLEIHARLWGVDPADATGRITDLLTTVGLATEADRPVGSYSGGQRRRLEIARALVSQPGFLFLDEPTVGLDPRIRYELLDLIAGIRDGGRMTILLTTHYLDEAERLCDRVAVMHEGRIVGLDTPAALVAGLGAELVELRVERNPAAALDALRKAGFAGPDAYRVGSTLSVPLHTRTASEAMAAIADLGIRTDGVSARRPTLDDVYLRLTGTRLAA